MDFAALTDFLAVADAGGVSAGARALGRPKQTVSRRLAALEADLGVRLFIRSTRRLRLTPEGSLLRDRTMRLMADLDDTRRTIADRSAAPAGLLRVSAPVLLGNAALGQVASIALARHPGLRLDVVLSDRPVDLVDEGFDVAIRVGPIIDSTLIARTLAEADVILVASPDFLARHAPVVAPADLMAVPCIAFGEGGNCKAWTLTRGDESAEVAPAGPLAATSLMLCLHAAMAGAGVALVPAFIAHAALRSGALVRLLPGWEAGRMPVRLVYPGRRLLSARLRAFVDVAEEVFADVPFSADDWKDPG